MPTASLECLPFICSAGLGCRVGYAVIASRLTSIELDPDHKPEMLIVFY
jgi:hypothetical protein